MGSGCLSAFVCAHRLALNLGFHVLAYLRAARAGKDVIGLAQTGSGKTGAFTLPILQGLLDKPQELYALVLSPTRELAIQIAEQVEALGSMIGVRCSVLVGGIDMMAQAISLAKRPHVIVGTPGRVVDHLSNTKVRRVGRTLARRPLPHRATKDDGII